jgi:enoyl-CoA hydratase/carnithine racemase
VEICLTGRRVGAEEAVASGLALRAVPAAELDGAVDSLVTALLVAPPKAAVETLGLLAGVAEGADPAAALAAERAAQLRRLRSLAAGEG